MHEAMPTHGFGNWTNNGRAPSALAAVQQRAQERVGNVSSRWNYKSPNGSMDHGPCPKWNALHAVTTASRLRDRMKPRKIANDTCKINIDAGRDQLRADTNNRLVPSRIWQLRAQLFKFLDAMCRAHACTEMHEKRICNCLLTQTLKELTRILLCIHDR